MNRKGADTTGHMAEGTHLVRDPLKGFVYSLFGTALVSTNFVTAKYGLQGFNPETFSLIWTVAAAAYTAVIVLITGHLRETYMLPRSALFRIIGMGVATGVGMILSWQGLARLDPSFASFLWRFESVLTVVFGVILLRERLLLRELVPMGVMVSGGLLSTIGRWNIVGVGTILTMLACCTVTVQLILAKTESRRVYPDVLVFYRVAIASAVITLWTFLIKKADFHAQPSYWWITLLGAFLGPCASFLLTFRAYRYWELSRATIVRTAQPLFVLPMALLFFHEIPKGRGLLGGLLILCGAFWLTWMHLGGTKKPPGHARIGQS
ncbi:hypothetical protein AMJ40_05605 [candidate division TA06 bacterium DG_26]|uniref:EamA domain-containing protein n=1 Tax=candidate division TA06 bacterium DG_26 TaxID=1703771 RepID=A0A0S7WH10_UNCT6|nr:MAG: hypothetical protein AMJ40_05605 [candidate division TA06 bacterium DG_26]